MSLRNKNIANTFIALFLTVLVAFPILLSSFHHHHASNVEESSISDNFEGNEFNKLSSDLDIESCFVCHFNLSQSEYIENSSVSSLEEIPPKNLDTKTQILFDFVYFSYKIDSGQLRAPPVLS
ncbi:hypothetical protein [Aureivirga sp. CE67]|uniref:hypothetical protein n=1 Tax=Aureivirga sp. CE67 TaxID=1788983 RepID=UPI001E4C4B0B|nr:hypothetical protein [Aureivirga sp. CE67]